MTTDPTDTPDPAENAAESPPEEPKARFDPFTNEGDMFKIVLWVGGSVLVVAVIAVVAGALL